MNQSVLLLTIMVLLCAILGVLFEISQNVEVQTNVIVRSEERTKRVTAEVERMLLFDEQLKTE